MKFREHKSDKNYPRVKVPLEKVPWSVDYLEYKPVDLYSNRHLQNTKDPIMPEANITNPKNPHRYADMLDIEGRFLDSKKQEYVDKISLAYKRMWDRLHRLADKYGFSFDQEGRPLNPTGRTGIKGLGLLWDWGPIFVSEAILVKEEIQDDGTKKYFIRVIRKNDETEWKFPAGARERDENDIDEDAKLAAQRELFEETGNNIDFSDSEIIFDGVTESGRNTDNSWMVSTACYKKVIVRKGEEIPEIVGGDEGEGKEVVAKTWLEINDENLKLISKNHLKMLEPVIFALKTSQ